MKISVKVIPKSSLNSVIGPLPDGSYKVKLTSAPVDGEANKKLLEILSKHFKIAKTKILLIKGLTSRNKIVEIIE